MRLSESKTLAKCVKWRFSRQGGTAAGRTRRCRRVIPIRGRRAKGARRDPRGMRMCTLKTALLWHLGCALPTTIASLDLPELCVLLSGVAWGNFPRIEQRYAPSMYRGMPPLNTSSSKCTFCTAPSQEIKLVMNWTSRLSRNDHQHVANKCCTKGGRGLSHRPPPDGSLA